MSRAYAEVIGDPVCHSKSPLIHGFWLERLGIEGDYRACHVLTDQLADYLAKRRNDPDWRGCNVTIPHKQAVGGWLDQLDPRATAIGAVNTIYRLNAGMLAGDNTDIDGVAEALAAAELAGAKVCVIGAGGAARAAFRLLSDKGCRVHVMARDPDRALRAAQECGLEATSLPFQAGTGALNKADVLINATQLGMSGQQAMPQFLLDETAELAENALVFDMVYAPLETALLASARAQGRRIADGLTMLVGQAASAFERFFGVSPPREHDTQLRSLLTR
ncbi:MAG: shikimate dehydrogenase [Novosphingobium sp.]|nr:shikimate dehydrogenase [Novosphingobium sp.]